MRRFGNIASITLVCFVLGILIVVQLRSTSRAASLGLSTSDQARVLAALVESNAALRAEVDTLETQIEKLNPADQQQSDAAMATELSRLLVASGGAAVAGPGIEMKVSGQLNPLDMQDLINELRNAGVEAIAINGNRVGVRSVVAHDGADLILDGTPLLPPYVMQAIGQPDTVETALLRRGGLVSLLEYAYPDVKIVVDKMANVILPQRSLPDKFRYAQPSQ